MVGLWTRILPALIKLEPCEQQLHRFFREVRSCEVIDTGYPCLRWVHMWKRLVHEGLQTRSGESTEVFLVDLDLSTSSSARFRILLLPLCHFTFSVFATFAKPLIVLKTGFAFWWKSSRLIFQWQEWVTYFAAFYFSTFLRAWVSDRQK